MLLSLINTSPFLIQVTLVAGPPVEVQMRVNTSVNVEVSFDVSVIELTSRFPASENMYSKHSMVQCILGYPNTFGHGTRW